MFRQVLLAAVVAVVWSSVWPVPAQAQQAGQGDTLLVWNATSVGALGTRRPGRLVDAGIGRYGDARARAFARPSITEQPVDPSPTKQIKIRFIEELFQNLNAVLLAFNNLLRAEGGLPPYTPAPITPTTGGSLL